ncbi:MAG TPA: type II toxin-antitoxin system HigB family toxin [Verrucomicrobiota bacterium]|nr:type II toxin-antitoxin system HigB family toxin [Verrucomicrobiota bacterium]
MDRLVDLGRCASLPLEAWVAEAKQADWQTLVEIKAQYGNVSILKSSRVLFNICGNNYRLVVAVHYATGIIFIRFIGTHDN